MPRIADPLTRLQSMSGRGPFKVYRCATCDTDADMTAADLDAHLRDVHGLDDDVPGTALVVVASDGAEYAATVTRWTFAHVEAEEYRQVKRRPGSLWDVDAIDLALDYAGYYDPSGVAV